jgi:hypothetical protein
VMVIRSSFVAVFMLIGFFDIFPNSNFQLWNIYWVIYYFNFRLSCKLMAYSINLNNKQLNSVNESRAGYPYATFYLIKLWIKFSNSKQLNLGNESRAGYPCSTFFLIKLVKF